MKETQLRLKTSDSASVLTCSKYNGLSSHLFGGEVLVLAPVFSTISHKLFLVNYHPFMRLHPIMTGSSLFCGFREIPKCVYMF